MLESVTIVGVGLIGGSFSLALKDKGLVRNVIGVGRSADSLDKALELGLIDEVLPLEAAVKKSDLIYVAIPVDATVPVMRQIMDLVTDKQIVADAGSTKKALCESLGRSPDAQPFCGYPSHVGDGIQRAGSGGTSCFCGTDLCDL
jgi:prephenate dehydrogenase